MLDGGQAHLRLKGGSARYQGCCSSWDTWEEVSGAEAENGRQEIHSPKCWEPQGAAHPPQDPKGSGHEGKNKGQLEGYWIWIGFGAGEQSIQGQKEGCVN